jgi:type II secretory pathway component GspD/PulD (secretin)
MNRTNVTLMGLLGAFLAIPAARVSAQSSLDPFTKTTQPPAVKAPGAGDLTKRVEELEKQVARLNREVESLKTASTKPSGQEQKTDFEIIQLKYVPVKDVHSLIGNLFSGKQGFSLAADANTNSLIVRGTPADVASLHKLVQRLDSSDARPEPPSPVFKTFTLKHVKAEPMSRLIQQFLKDTQLRVAAVNERTLVVYASPTRLVAVADFLSKVDVPADPEPPKK